VRGAVKVMTTFTTEFIEAVKGKLSGMKRTGQRTTNYVYTRLGFSPTSDIAWDTWNITFHNLQGRRFRSYIGRRIRLKNGTITEVQMPVEIWESQKQFIGFLMRECA